MKIPFFYHPEMVPPEAVSLTSQSPLKPKMFREFLSKTSIWEYIKELSDFPPFQQEDFYLAHEKEYVDGYFSRGDDSSGLTWSKELAKSVCYTNSSLYHAILHSIENPDLVTISNKLVERMDCAMNATVQN